MPLLKKKLENELYDFIVKQNDTIQTDPKKAARQLAAKMEKVFDERIKSLQITIPSGYIQVAGPSGVSTNLAPIILNSKTVSFK